jgi:NADH:ubiquinone oxidoreductase subunit 5 (subunit L)/multisubunit Na+/H+ antiporter MnhA subunit
MLLAGVAIFGGGTLNPLPHTDELWFNRLVRQPESAAAAGLHLEGHAEEAAHFEHVLHEQAHYPALAVSVLAILCGWLLARAMYLKRTIDPAAVSARFGPLHGIIANRYFLDELQSCYLVGGLFRLNRFLAGFDKRVIDGLVNLSALIARGFAVVSRLFDSFVIDGLVNFWRGFVRGLAGVLRLAQTGNARDYLTWTLLFVLILAFYLARGLT